MKRFAVALILVAVTGAAAIGAERHSGRIVAVDPAAGTVRIDELVEGVGSQPRAVERTLRLAPGATVQLLRPAARLDDAHWPNAWDSQPLSLAALKPGDFVTASVSGDEIVALDLVRPDEPR